jgi:enediyne biosynthesis protein E4
MAYKKIAPALCLLAFLLAAGSAAADGGVTYQDVAAGGGAGLAYGRTPSARQATLDAFQADGILDVTTEYATSPYKPRGVPGVALLDYDRDGDLDIYVTNGPGTPNSLFKNLLRETGGLQFADVAAAAGVALTAQDSQGVCFGDIDNDGDEDLYVLGSGDGNHLFENQGDGTFHDITGAAGAAGGDGRTGNSCAMGDVDGDGLLDIAIANAFDYSDMRAVTTEPFVHNQHNQLLRNLGGNSFADVSAAAGIEDLMGVPIPGAARITFAISLVDLDLDGDLDLVAAQDQPTETASLGALAFFRNDGSGHFTDATAAAHLDLQGSWRGVAFADYNCDGRLDLFATNMGDYVLFPGIFPPGAFASRWFLGQAGGTFSDPGPGALVTTPTGWGVSTADYDNDGDTDTIYHGGWDNTLFWDESNPGVLLQNQGCSATFTWDAAALAGSTDHLMRNAEGVATGDLDLDGFIDVVSVASFDLAPGTLLIPLFSAPLGSVFDPVALFVPAFVPTEDPTLFAWLGFPRLPGSLAVEVSQGNGNGWADFHLVGTKGLVDNQHSAGRVNRDGIGAVMRFTPEGGSATLTPVLGGSSHASQNSLTVHVGLGAAARGTAEVLWPGGVRNRLYDVAAGERLVLPEIPCSFDAPGSRTAYAKCVKESLKDLRHPRVGLLTQAEADRLEASALRAFDASH